LEMVPNAIHKQEHGRFTWEQIREMRRLYAKERMFQYEIAERFGTMQGCVGKVLRNEIWKDPDYIPNMRKRGGAR